MPRVKIDEIIKRKKMEIQNLTRKKSLKEVKREAKQMEEPMDFLKALSKSRASLIYEYKRASPSSGLISNKTLEEMVRVFETGGADAISIITEKNYFRGDIRYLEMAANQSSLPIMMKDFLVDEYQIHQARAAGASSVLLMVGVYPDLSSGIETCRSLGMEPLVECGSSIDIYRAIEAGSEIIGVNNRNFETFGVDLDRTRALAPLVPDDLVLVSESGVRGSEDVEILLKYGADALLIGTALMSVSDPLEMAVEIRDAANSFMPSRRGFCKEEFFEQFA